MVAATSFNVAPNALPTAFISASGSDIVANDRATESGSFIGDRFASNGTLPPLPEPSIALSPCRIAPR